MYTCILVGFDGSPSSRKAVDRAAELASRLGSRLLIVTVVPPPTILIGELLLPEPLPSEQLVEAVKEGLRKLAEELRSQRQGLDVETLVVEGDPAESLVETAKERGCGLIVVGRRGRGLAEKLLGSVSSKVVSIAKGVDVLVVEPER